MSGLTVAAAQRCVIAAMKRLGAESVPLQQALGRVLAEDVRANRDQPPYDVSAMDGFAIRSADVASAPAVLEVVEDIKAGDMPQKVLAAGQCARIMTGAPVPHGADAVIRGEDTQALTEGRVQIDVSVKSRNDIRDRGESMRTGEVVLPAGTEITPGVVGMLAMVKAAQVPVYRQPRVAILSTGDELEGLDEPIDANKIPDANSYALMAQVQALGIQPVLLGIARDDPDHLRGLLQRGLQFDVLLVSGGTSVGVHDYVRPTLEALGVQMQFWGVAMKPGHPMAFGVAPLTWVFGIPGNPVSSMVCFEEFIGPALRRAMGHQNIYRRTVTAKLARDVKHKHRRTEFVRVMLARDEGALVATPTGDQGSGILRSMAMAEGLMVVPASSQGVAAGAEVTVQLLDGTAYQGEAGGEW
ncbi:gephyrin-like molybdotransferase Glp [Ferriphaselus sp. R-1]|uniref:molybdopterin molybdotransferase MoeA n=1 Tax=Ferriphaselus sp. R-1 TaxID=1485544 RepID=UPI000556ED61|nr:gephyrin-like molybdotransferase Glp [Ferriphaselus sp. R-1]